MVSSSSVDAGATSMTPAHDGRRPGRINGP
jgi:hypothetical protein